MDQPSEPSDERDAEKAESAQFSPTHMADLNKTGGVRGVLLNRVVRLSADNAGEEPSEVRWGGKQLAVGLFGRHRRCTIHLFKGGILRVTAQPEKGSDRKGTLKKGWDTVSGYNTAALGEGIEAECWVEELAREVEVMPRKSKPQFNAVHLSFPPGMRELAARPPKAGAEQGTVIRVQLDDGLDGEEALLTAVNTAFTRMAHNRVNMHKKIAALLELRRTAFNSDEPAHVEQIHSLWRLIKGSDVPPPPLSREAAAETGSGASWSELGFQQGHAPQADFRSTGMLSLHCLCYYAEHHSGMVASLVDAGKERTLSYPFAAAGINIVNMIVQLLLEGGGSSSVAAAAGSRAEVEGLRSPLFVVLTRLEAREAERGVETLVCCAFALLEQLWVRHSATYMLFNRILDGVRDCLRLYVADEWRAPSGSLDGLRDLDITRVALPEPAGHQPTVPGPRVSDDDAGATVT